MKRQTLRHTVPAYPNAAERGYFAGRLLDILTAAAACMGFVTALVCLLVFL